MKLKLLRCQFLLIKLVKIQKFDDDSEVPINEVVSNTRCLTLLVGVQVYGSLWTAAQCFHPNNSPVILLPPLPPFLLFTADGLKGLLAFAFLMSSSFFRPHRFGFCLHDSSEMSLAKVTDERFSSSSYWTSQQHLDQALFAAFSYFGFRDTVLSWFSP